MCTATSIWANPNGGTSADSQRNHLHLTTTNDQRQQARGVHETSQTDSTCGNTRRCRLGGGVVLSPPPCWVVPILVPILLSYSASVNVCRHLR
ncbi:hypothetical protein GQ42DRAFT_163932 [Ramicandelaber brevisporus]|nr:hypothetical protein GQ42DRAFT_163932 [Ramicandelaber brevisporus]